MENVTYNKGNKMHSALKEQNNYSLLMTKTILEISDGHRLHCQQLLSSVYLDSRQFYSKTITRQTDNGKWK